jgi:hypothetical protein
VTDQEMPAYRRALETLASSGMVVDHPASTALIAEQVDRV